MVVLVPKAALVTVTIRREIFLVPFQLSLTTRGGMFRWVPT